MNLRSLSELFRLRQERAEDFSYKITASFYEVSEARDERHELNFQRAS
jgi:hypothetical protein